MLSYIYMKIIELFPYKYDKQINFISGGHNKKINRYIINQYVKKGIKILDIGCGTGTILLEAAKLDAIVFGIDKSPKMINVVKSKRRSQNIKKNITLYNCDITEIDNLFQNDFFDLIISKLVFSELSIEEQLFVLNQIYKKLKHNGKLILAIETVPKNLFKKILYYITKFPLQILTSILTQTTTRPSKNIQKKLQQTGFSIKHKKQNFWENFIIVIASKKKNFRFNASNSFSLKHDKSFLKSIWDYIGRWFPNPVEPGLRIIGTPDKNSPVILTSNFHLTVRQVEKSLQKYNVFLLVAPTNGINVWCASCGGEMNSNTIIKAIKTSYITQKTNHKNLILPLFSAPGVNRKIIKQQTKWNIIFGPAYIKDIGSFLKNTKTVFQNNKALFPFTFRLEMLLSMNFIVWLFVSFLIAIINPSLFLSLSIIFWSTGLLLYVGFPFIPGTSGFLKSFFLGITEILCLGLTSILINHSHFFSQPSLMLILLGMSFWFGFDLQGIVSDKTSEAEWLMQKLHFRSFGKLFSISKHIGIIHQTIRRCVDCQTCLMVCPKSVFGIKNNHIRIINHKKCFSCHACVMQCGHQALSILP